MWVSSVGSQKQFSVGRDEMGPQTWAWDGRASWARRHQHVPQPPVSALAGVGQGPQEPPAVPVGTVSSPWGIPKTSVDSGWHGLTSSVAQLLSPEVGTWENQKDKILLESKPWT